MKDPMEYKNIKALEELVKRAKLKGEIEDDITTAIKVLGMMQLIASMLNEGIFETYINNIGVMSLTEMDHFSSEFFNLLIFMKGSLQSRNIPFKTTESSMRDKTELKNKMDYTNGAIKNINNNRKSKKEQLKVIDDLFKLAGLFNDPAFTNFINEEEDDDDDIHIAWRS